MRHFSSPSFWDCYDKLPRHVQKLADKNFSFLKERSEHPPLHLKKAGRYWSARVGIKHRALAVEVEEGLLW